MFSLITQRRTSDPIMKKIFDILFSTKLMAVLFLVFAASMAVATFIENDYGTPTARKLVYASWWFELIMLFFMINFIGNVFRYRLFRREKWPVLLFHGAFILIILGAWVTRYVSYEGIMPIMEGASANKFLTEKVYVSVTDEKGKDVIVKKILLGKLGNNHFQAESDDGQVKIEFTEYVPNAKQVLTPDSIGARYLHIVEQSGGSRNDHFIPYNSGKSIHNTPVIFSTGKQVEFNGVNFFEENGQMKIQTNLKGDYMVMATQQRGEIASDSIQDFNFRALYTLGPLSFVVPSVPETGTLEYKSDDPNYFPKDLVGINLTSNGETKEISVLGGQYLVDGMSREEVGGQKFKVAYGSRYIELPFSIKLRDFQLERYPGSQSPMSYASEVTVIDEPNQKNFEFKIFMNNILNYQGYKFFQSSYTITPQGEETRLSVNHDALGTTLTYIGYGLLYLGLILIMILPGTRFSDLRKKLRKHQAKQVAILLLFFLPTNSIFAQAHEDAVNIDTFLKATAIPLDHATIFGRLVVQDAGGRMKPVNTFSSELLRKLTKHDSYHGLNADQILASMVINPRAWYYAPVIYMKPANKKVRKILGTPEDEKYARLMDFFDDKGGYKLLSYVEEASKKRIPGAFDESVVAIDQRVNLLYGVIERERGLRFFPALNDPNNKWYSAKDAAVAFQNEDSLFVSSVFALYAQSMMKAKEDGDDKLAKDLLNGIHKFQASYGAAVIPSQKQVDLEILYNKYDIFKKLFSYYMYIGTLLFFFVIFQLFKDGKVIRSLVNLSMLIIAFLFALHTAGLGVRWYISGHTPWSNAYEAMIYVAWATMLFGLVFGRKSPLTMGATAFLTSMMLMIAHWSWMDPAIENLVPVLNSYWLMIHVSIIVGSYGPFSLSMILGIIALLFMVLTNDRNKSRLNAKIKEITYINEMAMTVGLVMLTIGNFLGGQWANESWGRYWGWDPKETWALISIMVYAFILHVRLVPGLRNRFTFNMLSVFGYPSILMTFFGVNFYLAGLHSYAKGDPPPTPTWIYYFLGAVIALAVAAYFSYQKHYRKPGD